MGACNRDDQGRTALHWAAEAGLTGIAEALLLAYKVFSAAAAEAAAVRKAALAEAAAAVGAAVPEDIVPNGELPPAAELQVQTVSRGLLAKRRAG